MLTPSATNRPSHSNHEATVKQMQAEIEHLQQQLAQHQRLATLGELVGTTTHEFNNVLMSVINYTKLAMRQKDESRRQATLEKVLAASQRAAKITNGILSTARNRSQRAEPIELATLIQDALTLLERELSKYRVQVSLEICTVPTIQGFGNELQQVFINLFINARQAMPDGGELLVRLDRNESGDVELMIRDHGCGIPTEKLPHIFDPFFSTKQGPDETGKGGTGLGLSACRRIVESHHGRIRVASTVGKGTAFTLIFPTTQPASTDQEND